MRKLLFLVMLLTMTVSASAIKLQEGSLECLRGQKVKVVLDLSNTKYKESLTVDDFLRIAYREDNWMELSLHKFTSEFNKHSFRAGIKATTDDGCAYQMHIVPANIKRSGKLQNVAVVIVETATRTEKAVITLDSKEGDHDESNVFGDAMDDLGEQLGKFFSKMIK